MHFLTAFMNHYGYIVLFLSLTLGIMALPIPIEAIMGYAGLLSYRGQLNWFFCILSAAAGCTLGMVLAYLIGIKLGMPFFEKYGSRIHLGSDRLQATSIWFEKYGNKLLIIGLFIPGVRHITGYFSGITRLPIRIFSFYSAAGSLIWVSTFILLGKMLGPRWQVFQEAIKKYLVTGSIILVTILTIIYFVKKYKKQILQFSTRFGKEVLGIFHSRRRAELFLAVLSLITMGFIILMISFIQNYISNDIRDFDTVTNLLVTVVFNQNFNLWMNLFMKFGTSSLLVCMIFYTLVWIFWKGRNKFLEFYFLIITVVGGEFYEELLRSIFNRFSPSETPLLGRFPYSFPSEQTLMAFVIYGYFFFILIRHTKSITMHTLLIFCWIAVLLFIGISRIYYHVQLPSQIAAGYVFGGVWLGISTLLMEIFRMLISIDPSKKANEHE